MMDEMQKIELKQNVNEGFKALQSPKTPLREAVFSAAIVFVLGFFGSIFLTIANAESQVNPEINQKNEGGLL